MTIPAGTIRVSRSGGRGWHLIAISKYEADPGTYTVMDEAGEPLENPLAGNSGPGGGISDGDDEAPLLAIPDYWPGLHHNRKISMAEQIIGQPIEPTDGKTKTQIAEDIISAEVERRKAA